MALVLALSNQSSICALPAVCLPPTPPPPQEQKTEGGVDVGVSQQHGAPGEGTAKTLDTRRLCTDRRQDVAVIFSFGLDTLFTRDSRAHSSAVLSLPQLLAAISSYSDLTSCHWLL
jgi:hypothetical protein